MEIFYKKQQKKLFPKQHLCRHRFFSSVPVSPNGWTLISEHSGPKSFIRVFVGTLLLKSPQRHSEFHLVACRCNFRRSERGGKSRRNITKTTTPMMQRCLHFLFWLRNYKWLIQSFNRWNLLCWGSNYCWYYRFTI